MPDRETPDSVAGADELDLSRRLGTLTPLVDVDAAADAFGRRRVRQTRRVRAAQGVGVIAATLVLGLGVTTLQPGGDDTVVVGPADDPSDRPDAVSTLASSLQIDVTAPASGVVGTRVELTVRLRNTTDRDLHVGPAGQCTNPVAVEVRPQGISGPAGFPDTRRGPARLEWNGDPATLATHLRDGDDRPTALSGRSAENRWTREQICTLMATPPTHLAPGAEHVATMTVDLRWGIDPVPTRMELVASSGPVGTSAERLDPWADRATATIPFDLVDDAARAGSVDAALAPDAIPAAPTFDDWLTLTRPLGPPGAQTWQTSMTWWNGGWELWVDPHYLDGNVTGPLRVQWDPDAGQVTDVRTVNVSNGGSSDDPDAPDDVPPDDVRYRRD